MPKEFADVPVGCPNVHPLFGLGAWSGAHKTGFTVPKFGWLKTLKASARNCSARRSWMGNSRRTARSICQAPNPLTNLRGAVPARLGMNVLGPRGTLANALGFTGRPRGHTF